MQLKNVFSSTRVKQFKPRLLIKKPLFVTRVAIKYIQKLIYKKESLRGISFATTYKCNFRCKHCYTKRFYHTDETPLSFNEKIATMKECQAEGVISFDFVGGEIGIFKEFYRLLTYLDTGRVYISLASNGYHITRSRVRQLKKLGVDKISISIDSGTETEHDDFRRKTGSFTRCFEAINNIKAEGLTPVIITTISKGGTKEKSFWNLINYALKNNIQLVFAAAIPFGEWEGRLDLLCESYDLNVMYQLHEKYPSLTRDLYENIGDIGCPAVKQTMYISEFGDVMPCAFTHISFGNIKYEPIRKIRSKALKVKEFSSYHPVCLAAEDRNFIDKHLNRALNSTKYPIQAEELFNNIIFDDKNKSAIKNIKKKYRNCPSCGSDENLFVSAGREHEFDNTTDDLFCVVRCNNCDLVYLNPIPDDSTLDIIYPYNYYCHKEFYQFSSQKNHSLLLTMKNKLNKRIGYPRTVRNVLNSVPQKRGVPIQVLDIGCGNGSALDVFLKESSVPILTTGLDYNKKALEIVAKKGHKTIEGNIDKVNIGENLYDIIYSSNVIEHVANPLNMLYKIHNALKPRGFFICETPNFDSIDAKLFASSGHWGGFHFPRHWTFFTDKTITDCAEKVGLKISKIYYKPIPIFWIWTGHSYIYKRYGKKEADSIFPIMENKSNFKRCFIYKIFFAILDYIQILFTGKTSLLLAVMRK